jgi:hypothetical protein
VRFIPFFAWKYLGRTGDVDVLLMGPRMAQERVTWVVSLINSSPLRRCNVLTRIGFAANGTAKRLLFGVRANMPMEMVCLAELAWAERAFLSITCVYCGSRLLRPALNTGFNLHGG